MENREIPGQVQFHGPDQSTGSRLRWLSPLVRQSGDDYRRDWKMRRRRLFDYLVVLFPEGEGEGHVDGESFRFGAGDLIWIPPDTDHLLSGTCKCQFIHCDLIYSAERSHWNAYIPSGTVDLRPWKETIHPIIPDDDIAAWRGKLLSGASPGIHALFSEMCRVHARDPGGSHLLLSGMVNLLISLILLERGKNQQGNAWDEAMRNAARDIRLTIHRPLGVATLAKAHGLSESHFRKLFREFHAMSARTMHRRHRINAACSQLVYSNATISEIADDLGFAGIHSFSRTFKDVMGMSPSCYRRG